MNSVISVFASDESRIESMMLTIYLVLYLSQVYTRYTYVVSREIILRLLRREVVESAASL
jgi:hypothetical protein